MDHERSLKADAASRSPPQIERRTPKHSWNVGEGTNVANEPDTSNHYPFRDGGNDCP